MNTLRAESPPEQALVTTMPDVDIRTERPIADPEFSVEEVLICHDEQGNPCSWGKERFYTFQRPLTLEEMEAVTQQLRARRSAPRL
jgi:hypothetical protein